MAEEKGPRLRWGGSLAAQREYEEYIRLHPPKLKEKPKKPEKKLSQRAQRKRERKKQRKPPSPPPRGTPYAEYLRSEWWAWRRARRLKVARHRCERCGSRGQLQVHHKHYRSLGCEVNADLEVLCRPCHEHEHQGWIAAMSHLSAIARE